MGTPDLGAGIASVVEAISGLRAGFSADGYDIIVDAVTDRSVRLRVVATEGACADCLVPKAVLAEIVRVQLGPSYATREIEAEYPADLGKAMHG